MKRAYIAIAMVAMIAAVVLLSGCTSGPATNTTKVTATPVKVPTATTIPVTSTDTGVDAAGANMTGTATAWPEIRSGNNTSVINTTTGMAEVPNTMLGNNSTQTAADLDLTTTDAAGESTDAAGGMSGGNKTGAMGNQTGTMGNQTSGPMGNQTTP